MWWSSAVSLPAASAPSRIVCRVGPRWPMGPYIWVRVGTSFTGRPTSLAAMQASTCGPAGTPFEPKPPPRWGLSIWMSSGRMPNRPASRACDMASAWVGIRSVSRSPSQLATAAWGSMALWYWAGVS